MLSSASFHIRIYIIVFCSKSWAQHEVIVQAFQQAASWSICWVASETKQLNL